MRPQPEPEYNEYYEEEGRAPELFSTPARTITVVFGIAPCARGRRCYRLAARLSSPTNASSNVPAVTQGCAKTGLIAPNSAW